MKNPRHPSVLLAVLLLALTTISANPWRETGSTAEQAGGVRFATVEILIETGAEPLAAWQLEWSDLSGRASLVGIEGGEHRAFAEPARYDPQALAGGRVVLAAFSLAEELPVGRTRVASLHLEVSGAGPVPGTCRLVAAADAEGRELEARVALVASE